MTNETHAFQTERRHSTIPPPFAHQTASSDRQAKEPFIFDMSDPGTGKTRAWIDGFLERKKDCPERIAIVLAPKSILEAAWKSDIEKFAPNLKTSVGYAKNRTQAFEESADIYITNHDAVKWLRDNPWSYINATDLVVDESTAFKNPQAQRSKALKAIAPHFDHRVCMSGTPAPNTITDIWHQACILDSGERLGNSFWRFRASVCEPVQVGRGANMVQWVDKEGASEAVAALLDDISIRNVFEHCIDIPSNFVSEVAFTLPKALRKKYDEMAKTAMIQLSNEDISAVNRATVRNKLFQLASGGVYGNDQAAHVFATDRYELVIELAQQRESCVIAYNWTHQLDELVKIANRENISYAVINGAASDAQRHQAVNDFQHGKIKLIFAHPASASHGLTLTKGTTTIWCSPTDRAEHYTQFNRRIYRAGQTRKTETIHVVAEDTLEPHIYAQLEGKLSKQATLLDILSM